MASSIPISTLEKFTTFGDLLRFLRRRVGMTQMELSIAVGYSDTQISRLEQNLRLPDIPTIEARFISALDLEGEPQAVARLLELAANVRREDAPALGLCPYKGLNYFDEADADLFVGREALTSKLVDRVLSLASRKSLHRRRFLAVVGASGSGKSSLVRAGLISALRWNPASADWQAHILTPTAHPLESLAISLTRGSGSISATAALMDDLVRDVRSLHLFAKRRSGSGSSSQLLLVVDQFEEVFTLCRTEDERVSFIGNLLTAASEVDGPTLVAITIRADFYGHCANYFQLREALANDQEFIGPMNREELQQIIEEPARRGRWELEPGLVDLLLHDVGNEPGALPLLSHALLETWQRRRGRMMTLGGYASSGSVRGAIAETAESVFTDRFTQEQQIIARRIFLRLTELSEESASAADTRRRAKFDELILKPEEAATTHEVLKALADARLIMTSEDSAEVAHEALIREWPTLRGWLEENRERLRLHRQLTETAQEWFSMERSPDMLYRGTRLAQAREWANSQKEDLNNLEREFLQASAEDSERQIREREVQHQRELEAAQRLAEMERARAEEQTQSANRLRTRNRLVTTVGIFAIIMAILAGMFGVQSSQNASAAQAASTQSIADFTRSEAQRLASEANNLLLRNGDTNLIALLTIRSLNMLYTPMGDATLANLTTHNVPPRGFAGHTDVVWGVAFSPDGKYLGTGSKDKTARLWDLATGKTIRIFTGHTDAVEGVAFSPDGKYLLTASDDTTARLWDIASGQTVKIFSGHSSYIEAVAFSPDGKTIVTAGGDPTARIWDVSTGETLHILTGHNKFLPCVAFSPDGKYVLTGSVDKTARLWDAATGREVRVLSGFTEPVGGAAFSHDSKYFATANDDGTARLWNSSTGQLVREYSGSRGDLLDIKFSPDGRFLLLSSEDRTAQLWDIASGQSVRVFSGHGADVLVVAFSPDGRLIATGSDKIARVWNLQMSLGGMQFIGHTGAVRKASFSPDGNLVVTASDDLTARIWDIESGQTVNTLKGHTAEVTDAVFSTDGKFVLTTSADKMARLWDAATGKEMRRFEGHTDELTKAIFSPDGKYLVTASYDGTARVWETQTGKLITTYTNQNAGQLIRAAYSPNGKTVATTGEDDTARIWDPMTGKDVMIFRGHTDIVTGVAFSPDGKSLLTASWDGTARLWDIATGMELRQFVGHTGTVYGAAFSPNANYALTSGSDWTARLWDVQTGKELSRFAGHTAEVRYVTFSPDGKYILTASQDGTARLWLTDIHETIRAVCAVLARDITTEERLQFDILDQDPTCPTQ